MFLYYDYATNSYNEEDSRSHSREVDFAYNNNRLPAREFFNAFYKRKLRRI
jgi:hypothetical protein